MWSKEVNNLFCSHMVAIVLRTWSRAWMGISNKFRFELPIGSLHVHKLVMASFEVGLL
jgi:hypothetical protein